MDTEKILDRMIRAIGGKTQGDLGKILGISQTSISEAKRKGKVPPEWFLKLSVEKKLNPNWLLSGHGPMLIPEREIVIDYDLLLEVTDAIDSFKKRYLKPWTKEKRKELVELFYEDFIEKENAGIQRGDIKEKIHRQIILVSD